MQYIVQRAGRKHLPVCSAMGCKLWPHHSEEDMRIEFERILKSRRDAAFVCLHDGQAMGFVTVSMRVDYVQSSTTSPVGYLEGLFVEKPHRRGGAGALLVATAEDWARSRGATEMGSDAYASNLTSRRFHQAVGFQVTRPLTHFIKKI